MRSNILVSSLALFAMTACGAASRPSQDLVNARVAYERAKASETSRFAPASLVDAENALARAERAHRADPGSEKERAYAYIAERRAQLAEARGATAMARQDRIDAEQEYAQLQEFQRIADEQRAAEMAAARSSELGATGEPGGPGMRGSWDARAQKALDDLKGTMNVAEDNRGTVISIPGGNLFAAGGSRLLPAGRAHLDRIAEALKDQGERPISIEGFTDSRGSEEGNQLLSEKRADAVRKYLVEKGIDEALLSATGKGASNPIGDNDTAEGRAMNRRVEIVITRPMEGAPQPVPSETTPRGAPSERTPSGLPERRNPEDLGTGRAPRQPEGPTPGTP